MTHSVRKCIILAAVFLSVWLGLKILLPLAGPFVLGTSLALLADPLVRILSGKLRLPRSIAAFLGVSITFSIIFLVLLSAAALFFRELGALAGVLPDLEETARSGMSFLMNWLLGLADRAPAGIRAVLERSITELFSGGSALLDRLIRYILGLAGTILSHVPDRALSFGTGILSAYMISAKLPAIRSWVSLRLSSTFLANVPDVLRRIKATVGSYLKAQLKLSGITLAIITAGFLILQIPYAPLWALIVSLVDAFPVLGTGTILLPWSLVSFLQGNTPRAVGMLGIYAVVFLTRTTLEPRLLGKQLGLDPLVTLAALYVGYRLWGIGGMIFAPLLAVTVARFFSDRPAPDSSI